MSRVVPTQSGAGRHDRAVDVLDRLQLVGIDDLEVLEAQALRRSDDHRPPSGVIAAASVTPAAIALPRVAERIVEGGGQRALVRDQRRLRELSARPSGSRTVGTPARS